MRQRDAPPPCPAAPCTQVNGPSCILIPTDQVCGLKKPQQFRLACGRGSCLAMSMSLKKRLMLLSDSNLHLECAVWRYGSGPNAGFELVRVGSVFSPQSFQIKRAFFWSGRCLCHDVFAMIDHLRVVYRCQSENWNIWNVLARRSSFENSRPSMQDTSHISGSA